MYASVVLLVRYGEIALKSRFVRRQLEDLLASNIRDLFAANALECIVRAERGRVFVHVDDEPAALRLLRRVFGIVSISPAKEFPSDLEGLTAAVVAYARGLLASGRSFAIRARRSGEHPYTSQELARVLGRAVQDAITGLAVDLDEPDVELFVEVRGPKAYVFCKIVPGTGGLPLGSQGTVLAAVEDEEGLVAAWLAMRRGCRAIVAGRDGLVETLRRWDPKLVAVEPRPTPELLALAAEKGLGGVVVPAWEQAGSGGGGPMLLRPLIGMTEDEIRTLSLIIGEA